MIEKIADKIIEIALDTSPLPESDIEMLEWLARADFPLQSEEYRTSSAQEFFQNMIKKLNPALRLLEENEISSLSNSYSSRP